MIVLMLGVTLTFKPRSDLKCKKNVSIEFITHKNPEKVELYDTVTFRAVFLGRQGTHSLAIMRYSTFSKKVVSASSFVKTEHLLSTECVTKLYCCRTYLQPGQDMITVSNVIKLIVSTIYTCSYYLPIDAISGI